MMKNLNVIVAVLMGLLGILATQQCAGQPALRKTLQEARQDFVTKIIKSGEESEPPEAPDENIFNLIRYESPVGALAAYVTPDPGDSKEHPAIVWIHGGDCNSIGDVWTPKDRSNDQSVSAFRKAGVVMMFPSLRRGNDNPGEREGFYGEVDDIIAATHHLADLPYVDPDQIYLGGHSTGGTMAMLVAAYTEGYRAVFALGPVAAIHQYGGEFVYCDPKNKQEMNLRSPISWLHSVQTPLFVFEGENSEAWSEAAVPMAEQNKNPKIQFLKVPGHDHFTVIAPLTEKLAQKIVRGNVEITPRELQRLR